MASTTFKEKSALTHSGFFALRTPLLPFDEIQAWSSGLDAPARWGDPSALERAIATDRSRLHERLVAAMSRPELREALFLASPDLDERFDLWVRDPDSERGRGIGQAMLRYFLRMAGRATPFGLCAGCSIGTIGDTTRLEFEDRSRGRRHSRLDMDYLHSLTGAMAVDAKLREVFTYRPNSSLYRAAGRWRYAEAFLDDKKRAYRLVAVDETAPLNAALTRAQDGATFAELTLEVADEDIMHADAEEFVAQLIENQILVPDIALCVTGNEPLPALIDQFSSHAATVHVAKALEKILQELAALDAAGLGCPPGRYRAAARLLADLPGKVALPRLFQVDLVKPAPQASLGGPVLAEIVRGVELLHRLARTQPGGSDQLARFRDVFKARYEERSVPLAEALDGEIGIGFPVSRGIAAEASPLLKGLVFPGVRASTAPWDAREILLLRKLSDALQRDSKEIVLQARDIDEMALPIPAPLPDAFAVEASVAAVSAQALASGDFCVSLMGGMGPSGAVLLGRFCRADSALRQMVEHHLRAEEAMQPEAIFAEIVHLPEGRMGNVLARPVLRGHEIPYLGCSGAAADKQILLTDLHLSVRGDRLALHSARSGREIIPRVTSAHNFSWRSLPIYRFLCALQSQGMTQLFWDWGALESAPFLPRVTTGRIVLSRARWRAPKDELRRLAHEHGVERFRAVQSWRAARKLPRWLALSQGDQQLPFDLDNVCCVETLVDMCASRDEAAFIELFPSPDLLCATSPEGRFVHELIIPFVRTKGDKPPAAAVRASGPLRATAPSPSYRRSFPPGSEWLYAKLYTGTATADRVLTEVIAPLVQEWLGCGMADGWFFIRHGDPEPHLRLRFHGVAERLHGQAIPALKDAVAPLLADGSVWRMQCDTYEREVERYGGPEGTALAERLFQVDSEAALEILAQVEMGDAGLDERWRLTLHSMDLLCADLGLDLPAKTAVIDQVRTGFAEEFRADARLRIQLGDRFRKERRALEALLDPAHQETHPLAPGFAILKQRSERLAPIAAELKFCEEAGRLTMPVRVLAASFLHMTANRLLRSAHRAQELVLYDFLARLYDSQSKRR